MLVSVEDKFVPQVFHAIVRQHNGTENLSTFIPSSIIHQAVCAGSRGQMYRIRLFRQQECAFSRPGSQARICVSEFLQWSIQPCFLRENVFLGWNNVVGIHAVHKMGKAEFQTSRIILSDVSLVDATHNQVNTANTHCRWTPPTFISDVQVHQVPRPGGDGCFWITAWLPLWKGWRNPWSRFCSKAVFAKQLSEELWCPHTLLLPQHFDVPSARELVRCFGNFPLLVLGVFAFDVLDLTQSPMDWVTGQKYSYMCWIHQWCVHICTEYHTCRDHLRSHVIFCHHVVCWVGHTTPPG